MAISNQKKEQIAEVVIKILYSRFESFPQDASGNRNAPFHEAFLNAFSDKFDEKVTDIPFFISMSSWLHGLNTTMGQTFFESVAQHVVRHFEVAYHGRGQLAGRRGDDFRSVARFRLQGVGFEGVQLLLSPECHCAELVERTVE